MTQSQFALLWDAHKTNICTGLSALQQNGEFVDMTLAADGHHVKVHQVIMALGSQYIKELIASAQCPHPVIFLNKVSYNTLSSILEYIYTGEVQVPVSRLSEFMQAGKDLHIRGLEDMIFNDTKKYLSKPIEIELAESNENDDNNDTEMMEEYGLFSEYEEEKYTISVNESQNSMIATDIGDAEATENYDDNTFQVISEMEEQDTNNKNASEVLEPVNITPTSIKKIKIPQIKNLMIKKNADPEMSIMQYTISTQGSLQMILNRFLYYLKHMTREGQRHWRCVDYITPGRCPAIVITRDDMVIQRSSSHNHTFHDRKILKKVRNGAIFTAINEAEKQGTIKKGEKESKAIQRNQEN